ncbi:zinc-dependent metalloprotease [Ornithinimicrobium faecis]|uniref:Zinc-dependent metalloprotease n=1 Tax=Ornithinimicrobium faecis TaxID=2934158 RepID=A0ABY4YWD9_9MICO|nr:MULTISPECIES: zinc-dependent metalloprotease [unclassified Ornithinimicrobium]USQ81055.1 zinc-dependent metalloprotease [Ornithinimicrobium sp. HY1793]
MSDEKNPGTPGAGDDETGDANQPIGFRGSGDKGDAPTGGAQDPLAAMFGGGELPPELRQQLESMGLGDIDPAMMQMVQSQVQAMMSGSDDGSAVNMSVATDAARRAVSEAGDQSISESTARDVEQVVQVANLWLDQVTDMAPPEGRVRALSRAEWVELSMPVWETLTEPVAAGVSAAMTGAMQDQLRDLGDGELPQIPGLPEGMDPRQLLGQIEPMMRRMSSGMFGAQVGQAVGTLATETVSGTEVGLPLLPGETIALLPANVATFAEGLGVDAGEVHLYLAVREAARVRLFAAVPWLGPQLLTAVQDYARDIRFDTEGIEAAVRSVDPSDPQAMQEAVAGSLFSPDPSQAQRAALTRLETYLALVEGWVDVVAGRASSPHLPNTEALAEAVRRRRATGGPAEKAFASLVGLELRPRRLRDAANLWAALESEAGAAARDRAWAHPDLAPRAADLDDPLGFVERATSTDTDDTSMDEELERLLRDERD